MNVAVGWYTAQHALDRRWARIHLPVLMAVIVLLLLWPKYLSVGFGPLRVSPYHLVVLAALLVVGIYHLASARFLRGQDGIANLAVLLFCAFWSVRFVASVFGIDPGYSLYTVIREALLSGSVFFLALSLGKLADPLRVLTRVTTLGVPVLLLVALIEVYTYRTAPDLIFSFLPITIDPDFLLDLTLDKARDGAFRAQSMFTHPIMLGVILSAFLPYCLAMTLNARGAKAKIKPAVLVLCCLLGIMTSGARSGQLGALVGVAAFFGIYLAMNRGTIKFLFLAIPVIGIAAALLYEYVLGLIIGRTSNEQLSSYVRGIMWDHGWPAFLRRPLLGYGEGMSRDLAGLKTTYGIRTVDDYYLTLLLDFGIIGLALAAAFVVVVLIAALTSGGSPKERRLIAGLAGGIVAVVIAQKANSLQEAVTYVYLFSGVILATRARTRLALPRVRMVRSPPQGYASSSPVAAA